MGGVFWAHTTCGARALYQRRKMPGVECRHTSAPLETLRPLKSALWICFCACLAIVARCHDVRQVFVNHAIYLNDPGDYARLVRVRGLESAFAGTAAQSALDRAPAAAESVPLDFLVLGLKKSIEGFLLLLDPNRLSVLRGQELDLAGAVVAPLLAFFTCLILGFWARNAAPSLGSAAALPFLYAASPLLAHAALLGAPTDGSLLLLALALGLVSEFRAVSILSRPWIICGGAMWALALWISWRESLVLMGALVLIWGVFHPNRLFCAERWFWLLAFCLVASCAIAARAGAVNEPASSLDLLRRASSHDAAAGVGGALGWVGGGFLAAPVLLFVAGMRDRRAWVGLLFLVLMGLAGYVRGAYGLQIACLLFVMALPWMLEVFRRQWVGWGLLMISLWPLASLWDRILYPEDEARQYALQRGMERVLLRDVSLRMRTGPPGKFLAPWWLSPALAYWSGQPALTGAGRLHSPGVLDSARFYLSESPLQAEAVVERGEIRWVVADDPARVVADSREWLAGAAPEMPIARALMERPHSAAPWLKPVFANQFFKLFLVDPHNIAP
jgi:hypothetical protein